jgi:hypothetical protein
VDLKVKHYGKVEKGKKKYFNPIMYAKQLEALEGKEFVEIISERPKKRTPDQHGYYFGGVLGTCLKSELFSHFNSPEEIHEAFFGPQFLSYTIRVEMGREVYNQKKERRLSSLNRKEFAEFIDKVIRWCAMHDIIILSPDDYYQEYYKTVRK